LFIKEIMMKLKATALLITSLLVLAGCEQAEKSAQQLMGKAAESAKQAIDDTHKAAEQALSDATGTVIGKKESSEKGSDKSESTSQEI
jgi:vacuolar-type H+-ATPase subunit H